MQPRVMLLLCGTLALVVLPRASAVDNSANRFDGNWTTHMACEAHGETPAYKFEFPSIIKEGNFHGMHSQPGEPGYLVIDGKISDDGSAKLAAKGTVTQNHAHGVFAMKGNNYSYNIKAQFTDTRGTGSREEGAGILGRACSFEFDKQGDNAAPAQPAN